jgi:hypothetical protein
VDFPWNFSETFQALCSRNSTTVSNFKGTWTKRIGTSRIGTKCIGDKTYRRQNISATKPIGDKTHWRQNVSATKRIGDKTYHLSATKSIVGQNASAKKRIGWLKKSNK